MSDCKKLAVWSKSHQFALDIYKSSAGFPKDEVYGASQASLGGQQYIHQILLKVPVEEETLNLFGFYTLLLGQPMKRNISSYLHLT